MVFGITGSLKCVLYVKFHTTKGPEIVYEYPKDYISEDLFKSAFEYICPKQELADCLVKYGYDDLKIVGCPVWLSSTVKYQDDRSTLRFNVCFVFDCHEDVTRYESCIRKLSTCLKRLEMDCDFITNNDSQLESIIQTVYDDLNSRGYCNLVLAGDTQLALQVNPQPAESLPVIKRSQVPVLLASLERLKKYRWDMMSAKLIPVIDGIKTVQQLINECNTDADLTISCIRNLLYMKLIVLVPVFRLSNVYLLTSGFDFFQKDETLRQKCLNFVRMAPLQRNGVSNGHSIGESDVNANIEASSSEVRSRGTTIEEVINLYSLMSTGLSLQSVLDQVRAANVDLRRLVQFGVIHGFLRRLFKYPYLPKGAPVGDVEGPGLDEMRRLFDGSHSTEELASLFNVSLEKLEAMIESYHSIILYMR